MSDLKIIEAWVRFSQEEKPHRAILGVKTFCGKLAYGDVVEVLGGGFKSDEICQECLSKMKEKKEGKFDPMSLLGEKTPEPKPKKKSKKKKKLKEKSQDDVNTVEFTIDPDNL